MSTQRKNALGRGLDSIFADNSGTADAGRLMVRLSDIQPRADQPRKVFDQEALSQLAESIAAQGLIQPVIVREAQGGFYEIIAGERRWRASKMAGLSEIPVVVLTADDRKSAEMALVENIQRQDLNPIEEAGAYRALMEEYSLTQEQLSAQVGKSRSAVANSLRLLDLPDDTLALVGGGRLSSGHAKVLLSLADREMIHILAHKTIDSGLSVRELEGLVRQANRDFSKRDEDGDGEESAPPIAVDYNAELESALTEKLGRRVCIKKSGTSRKLELYFSDDRDLEQIISALCGENILD
ncbi:MAG: ParB/RepB/Spo0J family partition protein [Oscillospiraceae bacterium]|nr:ParB/RepB/Spo0J family partition protein [Oscillospiraceae bacterium]